MSTVVKAPCPTCGVVEFGTDVIRLRICLDPRQSYWAFICPECSDDVYQRACRSVISLLVSANVPAVVWDVPDELLEDPRPGALTLDHLIDLHEAIEAHNASAAASDQPQPPRSAIARLTAALRPHAP